MGALKNTLNFLAWGALGALIVTAVSAGIKFDWGTFTTPHEEISESVDDGLNTSVSENGIKLKLLGVETLANGDTEQTFSYTITPANATNQQINATVQYQSGGAATEVTAAVNTGAKTITITCKQAFSKVINVILTAADGGGATATITCNYQKKITDINFENAGSSGIFENTNLNSGNVSFLDFLFDNENSNPFTTYSIYTQDFNYLDSATISDASVTINYLNELDDSSDAYTAFENFLTNKGNAPSASQIWSWADETGTQSDLKTNNYLNVELSSFSFKVSNGNTIYSYQSADTMTIKFIYNFSTLQLDISSINLGQSTVLF